MVTVGDQVSLSLKDSDHGLVSAFHRLLSVRMKGPGDKALPAIQLLHHAVN